LKSSGHFCGREKGGRERERERERERDVRGAAVFTEVGSYIRVSGFKGLSNMERQ